MHFSISIVLIILCGTSAAPVPTRRVGELVKFKPKHLTPVYAMDNAKGLDNNHHGIILGGADDGRLRVTHVSSNPPPPNIHVHSVVTPGGPTDITGKIHVGHSAVDPANVKDSSRFAGQHITVESVEKIKLAGQIHPVAQAAAAWARGRQ